MTAANLAHLVVVVAAIAAFVVLGVTRTITADACVTGITGVVVGAFPAGAGVVARERSNGRSTGG